MAIGVKSGGLFSGIFLGYICACLQLPSKGLRVVVLMAYLKIIWGFWAALLFSERKYFFQITGLISLVGSFSSMLRISTGGGQAAILS
jgi:hypothetical protein